MLTLGLQRGNETERAGDSLRDYRVVAATEQSAAGFWMPGQTEVRRPGVGRGAGRWMADLAVQPQGDRRPSLRGGPAWLPGCCWVARPGVAKLEGRP